MKNLIILLTLLIIFSPNSKAQENNHSKGTWFIGVGNIQDVLSQNVQASPLIAYEVKNDLVLGGVISNITTRGILDTLSTFNLGVEIKKFLILDFFVGFDSNVSFVESYGVSDWGGVGNSYYDSYNYARIGLSAGKMLFLGKHMYVEPLVRYSFSANDLATGTGLTTGVRVGVLFPTLEK